MKFIQSVAVAAILSSDALVEGKTKAAKCVATKYQVFSDSGCKKAGKIDEKRRLKNWNTAHAPVGCMEVTENFKYYKITCDATGVVYNYYKDKKCKTPLAKSKLTNLQKEKATKVLWGACTKIDSSAYYRVTDSNYLRAGAVAAFALIASQF